MRLGVCWRSAPLGKQKRKRLRPLPQNPRHSLHAKRLRMRSFYSEPNDVPTLSAFTSRLTNRKRHSRRDFVSGLSGFCVEPVKGGSTERGVSSIESEVFDHNEHKR